MTLIDEFKILDNKIKANQDQYDLCREAAKISALPSKDLLGKYECLTGDDLGHRPIVLKKTKFEYSPLGMSLSKSFKKDNVKNIANKESDLNHDGNYKFYKFYKGYNEFEEMSLDSKYKFYKFYKGYDEFGEMSLDSKYNRIKESNKLLIKFKTLKSKKPETQFKKERIMKNVDQLYKKYYNAYKNDYDNDDELNEAKKKKFDYKQFQLFDKIDKKLILDEGTKEDEESKLTKLPKWLYSENDFKKTIKLIEDIRVDTGNVKSSSGDKNFFNNFDKLLNDIKKQLNSKKKYHRKNKEHCF